jgi:hypothetical protein
MFISVPESIDINPFNFPNKLIYSILLTIVLGFELNNKRKINAILTIKSGFIQLIMHQMLWICRNTKG